MAYRISYTHAAGTAHATADTAADTLHKGREFDQQGFHVRIIDEHDREFNLAAFEELLWRRGELAMPKRPKGERRPADVGAAETPTITEDD